MCGICGRIGQDPTHPEQIAAMTRALAHRGPDDEGTWSAGGAALGHRRLSIIDASGGRQPMSNPAGTVHLVFNGEIYNHEALRARLKQQGRTFRTRSDTEVILHLYELHGPGCVRHLRGMFAFALWDQPRQRLLLARDHLGQKPLYYAHLGHELLFASEIKALLAAAPALREIDLSALEDYFALRLIPAPRSMFRGIRKLPPGHLLTCDAGAAPRVQRYWNLTYEPKWSGSDEELVDAIEEQLVDSLKAHLVSDVPVGAFLSGGLDSTLLVALLHQHRLVENLPTFSLGLPYGAYDEAPAARAVARRYRTRHHERRVQPSLLAALPRLVEQLDEPSDPLAACMDLVARMASEHVKVVLGGDGGDELFGGYDRYYGNQYAELYARVPRLLRRAVIGPVLRRCPGGRWYKSLAHQLKWLHRLADFEGGERYLRSLEYFYLGAEERSRLAGPRLREHLRAAWDDPGSAMAEAYDHAPAGHMLDRMLYADLQARLPDHPVMIQDRMTMAYGLEARSPFMDHQLVEFAARLPTRLKVRGRTLRYAQWQLARRYLPPEVLARKKQGFASALPYLLKEELARLHTHFLHDMALGQDGIINEQGVAALLREHQQGRVDHGQRLWLLVNAEVWYRMFIRGVNRSDLEDQLRPGSLAAAA